MLSSETKIVTYVNKRGERTTYPLGSAMDSVNLEMVKRLKYSKDILTHILDQNKRVRNRSVELRSSQSSYCTFESPGTAKQSRC